MFGCPYVENVMVEHMIKENTCCQSISTHRLSVNFLETQYNIFHVFPKAPYTLKASPKYKAAAQINHTNGSKFEDQKQCTEQEKI